MGGSQSLARLRSPRRVFACDARTPFIQSAESVYHRPKTYQRILFAGSGQCAWPLLRARLQPCRKSSICRAALAAEVHSFSNSPTPSLPFSFTRPECTGAPSFAPLRRVGMYPPNQPTLTHKSTQGGAPKPSPERFWTKSEKLPTKCRFSHLPFLICCILSQYLF